MPSFATPLTTRRIELPRSPRAGGQARGFLSDHFQAHLGPSAFDNARLVASELVNNAFVHGCGAIALRAQLHGDRLRIEVIDQGRGEAPVVREQAEHDPGGWGLRIVDSLSLGWGAFEGTTHVWADMPLG